MIVADGEVDQARGRAIGITTIAIDVVAVVALLVVLHRLIPAYRRVAIAVAIAIAIAIPGLAITVSIAIAIAIAIAVSIAITIAITVPAGRVVVVAGAHWHRIVEATAEREHRSGKDQVSGTHANCYHKIQTSGTSPRYA
jgi:hypothetical protein